MVRVSMSGYFQLHNRPSPEQLENRRGNLLTSPINTTNGNNNNKNKNNKSKKKTQEWSNYYGILADYTLVYYENKKSFDNKKEPINTIPLDFAGITKKN
jgi:hypothetical protein